MTKKGWSAALALLVAGNFTAGAVAAESPGPQHFGAVSEARLRHADGEPDQWLAPGRDAEGTYYSPLDAINDKTIDRLGFAWNYALPTSRGLEATPVVVDSVLYTAGNWGKVFALDAITGKALWTYDPGVPGQWGRYACCDVVNRGVAVMDGKVYVGTIDGYLDAIDAATGKRSWRADTLPGRGPGDFHYFITGAPTLAGDLIVIGNGGGDFAGARGFITAFDRRTGALRWRFYTVPRDPRRGPQEAPHLDKAVKSWPRGYDWTAGGGGSVWDGISYDPELGLIYFGTGNRAPYGVSQTHDDDLYVASLVAVHGESGRLAWYFQEIPGEGWDYDADAKLTLADIDVAGKQRHVLMQASKDGFFYTLDRATGEVISANPYARVNWTRGLDPRTHHPIASPAGDWSKTPKLIYPAPTGAHGWQPMSFDRKTGLVYIPVIDAPMVYINTEDRRAGLIEGNFDLAFFFPEDYDPEGLAGLLGHLPSLAALDSGKPSRSRGVTRAFDPIRGKTVWEQPGFSVWDGGVLSTGGNLVLRGDAEGYLNAYAADTGRVLKRIDVGTSIMAAPMTYRVKGEQYIAVMAGFGGGLMANPFPKGSAAYKYGNAGRIVAFRLGGGETPKPPPMGEPTTPTQPPQAEGSAAQIADGEVLYNRYCSRCHVFGRGLLPDLRQMSPATHLMFEQIVLKGAYQVKGMARWDDVLSRADEEAIHAYLIDQARQNYAASHPQAPDTRN
jgi:quinohemoprotein ethanol dehydrogenase